MPPKKNKNNGEAKPSLSKFKAATSSARCISSPWVKFGWIEAIKPEVNQIIETVKGDISAMYTLQIPRDRPIDPFSIRNALFWEHRHLANQRVISTPSADHLNFWSSDHAQFVETLQKVCRQVPEDRGSIRMHYFFEGIREREFLLWPVKIGNVYVTIFLRIQDKENLASRGDGLPHYPREYINREVTDIVIVDPLPAGRGERRAMILHRLDYILLEACIDISADHNIHNFRTRDVEDEWETGLIAYAISRELMRRLRVVLWRREFLRRDHYDLLWVAFEEHYDIDGYREGLMAVPDEKYEAFQSPTHSVAARVPEQWRHVGGPETAADQDMDEGSTQTTVEEDPASQSNTGNDLGSSVASEEDEPSELALTPVESTQPPPFTSKRDLAPGSEQDPREHLQLQKLNIQDGAGKPQRYHPTQVDLPHETSQPIQETQDQEMTGTGAEEGGFDETQTSAYQHNYTSEGAVASPLPITPVQPRAPVAPMMSTDIPQTVIPGLGSLSALQNPITKDNEAESLFVVETPQRAQSPWLGANQTGQSPQSTVPATQYPESPVPQGEYDVAAGRSLAQSALQVMKMGHAPTGVPAVGPGDLASQAQQPGPYDEQAAVDGYSLKRSMDGGEDSASKRPKYEDGQ
ncbi:Uu.00g107990.m01.CDS01 [Anthostomella pinea]|uniref:Uu.00g107990.m01.CDS01 n=1 Tax=Anthostomella pinea TaxID=933095 RepID=A0AAI8YG62_9PEZI|nr:Uu.00g107990.m01.CDS01 [Anthostomella pinea]